MARSNAVAQVKKDNIPSITGRKIKIENMVKVEPKTETQRYAMTEWACGQHLVMKGSAGTGKSFVAIAMALRDILLRKCSQTKLIIIRSTVPTRDVGFLPGTLEEKIQVYEKPYVNIFNKLFTMTDGRSTVPIIERLRDQKIYEFESTSFLRGDTFDDAIVIVDEAENCTFQELDTIMTRLGENCRIIFCGDEAQTDFVKKIEKDGFPNFLKVINKLEEFSIIDFLPEDIVRSDLVKRYIIARDF